MITRSAIRYLLLGCGWVALGLGAAGVVLPILPTAPFVLLAAVCFMHSSESLHRKVVEHPVFGCHVRDYMEGKGLHRRTKVYALAMLWLSVSFSAVLLVPLLIADALLVGAAGAVSVYLLRVPTCRG